jgi:hypothetical protein
VTSLCDIWGIRMNKSCMVGLCGIALVTIPAFPNSAVPQGKSLKDHLSGLELCPALPACASSGDIPFSIADIGIFGRS